ncbi:MAG: biotin/lipoyl-binding protein, partial [Actinobacteria bacterium]|nr:biotin/lipoyl-binding protein [Actinomycetota bacterium]
MAVVTIERGADQPLTVDEIETLRLTCDLSTARLHDLHQHDRWIGAKAASGVRAGAAWLVGARHTWAKLAGLAVLGFLLFAFLVKGADRIDAGFEIQANARRQVPAPFPGRIESVNVRPGDPAEAGVTVLGTLETAELQLRLSAVQAERAGYLKEADLALRDDEQVEVQIAEANLQRTDAEIRLL